MPVKVGINGFGRIGRMAFRAGLSNQEIEFVGINDLTNPSTLAHLLKYDSVHGSFKGEVEHNGDHFMVNNKKVIVLNEPDPANLSWASLKIDVVIESTGEFVEYHQAIKHVEQSGARKVIISAPAKGEYKN